MIRPHCSNVDRPSSSLPFTRTPTGAPSPEPDDAEDAGGEEDDEEEAEGDVRPQGEGPAPDAVVLVARAEVGDPVSVSSIFSFHVRPVHPLGPVGGGAVLLVEGRAGAGVPLPDGTAGATLEFGADVGGEHRTTAVLFG